VIPSRYFPLVLLFIVLDSIAIGIVLGAEYL
jgi:hypothetical protein